MAKITSKWTTIAVVGYTEAVSHSQNRAAHGGVCLLQARRGSAGLLGRKVNSNGRHDEIGESFPLDQERLAQWEKIAASSR